MDALHTGAWTSGSHPPAFRPAELSGLIQRVREPLHLVYDGEGRLGVASGGAVSPAARPEPPRSFGWMTTLPPLYPEWLGDRSFLEAHRVRFPYVAGEMASGIATAEMVIEMGRAGMLAFFGSAGVPLPRIEQALDQIAQALGPQGVYGANLIHSPQEPGTEEAVVDLFLRRGVRRMSASAFMTLSPAVVRYAASGLTLDAQGRTVRPNHVFAKLSRTEVAQHFLSPPPQRVLQALVAAGKLTELEARLAAQLPVAEDVTVEADSGGHTDNRPLTSLFPAVLALRNQLAARHEYRRPIRIGAAGGLGTPAGVAAAFALGAAYVLTGSVNQVAVEAGTSDEAKQLLAQAQLADVIMAPSADMFELGVKVQVLRRGTMYGPRAHRLYDLYTRCASLEEIPPELRAELERDLFHAPLTQIWDETRRYWERRDPHEVERAERDPRHRMALVFRWYLGSASRWAQTGEPSRRLDYQIWCGPALGAFNGWVAGSFLADPRQRTVVQIARNLLEGAAVVTRAQQLRSYGVPVPAEAFDFRPRLLS